MIDMIDPLKIHFNYLDGNISKSVEVLMSDNCQMPNLKQFDQRFVNPGRIDIQSDYQCPKTGKNGFLAKWMYMSVFAQAETRVKLTIHFNIIKARKVQAGEETTKREKADFDFDRGLSLGGGSLKQQREKLGLIVNQICSDQNTCDKLQSHVSSIKQGKMELHSKKK